MKQKRKKINPNFPKAIIPKRNQQNETSARKEEKIIEFSIVQRKKDQKRTIMLNA